ncbi:MAG TPA: ImmA/IrrE family metallo-endopeptidase [Nitrospirota bacterium]
MKKDDSKIPPEALDAIKKQAFLALKKADAFGIFPTPVDQVLDIANVILAPDSDFGDGLLERFKKKFGSISDLVKKAKSKIIGLFDVVSKVIFIEKSLYPARKIFLKLHETGHAFLPWQSKAYALIEECEQTLSPEIADQFDCEANVFAKEVLFQCGSFTKEAADFPFRLATPIELSKKYGASIYASIREYVRSNHNACTALVLEMPEFCEQYGFKAKVRRTESSAEFIRVFGQPSWPPFFSPNDSIGSIIPVGKQRASKPKTIVLADSNGVEHECITEAFTQTYQVFILICPIAALTKKTFVISRS